MSDTAKLVHCKKCKTAEVNIYLRTHEESISCVILCSNCNKYVTHEAPDKIQAKNGASKKWNKLNA